MKIRLIVVISFLLGCYTARPGKQIKGSYRNKTDSIEIADVLFSYSDNLSHKRMKRFPARFKEELTESRVGLLPQRIQISVNEYVSQNKFTFSNPVKAMSLTESECYSNIKRGNYSCLQKDVESKYRAFIFFDITSEYGYDYSWGKTEIEKVWKWHQLSAVRGDVIIINNEGIVVYKRSYQKQFVENDYRLLNETYFPKQRFDKFFEKLLSDFVSTK
jgi:hypothetical protein